jgi:integrase
MCKPSTAISSTQASPPRTVQYIHATLHKALDQAVKWRLMPYNVSDVVTEPPQKTSERDALTLRQVWNFLEVAKGNVLRIHIVLTGRPTAPVL